MKKDLKELILFIIGFIFIIIFYYLYILAFKPFLDILVNKYNIDFLFLTLMSYLIIWSIQFFIPLIASIMIIKRSNNKYLLKLYNNLLIPTFLFISCIGLDFLVNQLYTQKYDGFLGTYNLFTSLTKNFLPIYIVAVVNSIRLKITKRD